MFLLKRNQTDSKMNSSSPKERALRGIQLSSAQVDQCFRLKAKKAKDGRFLVLTGAFDDLVWFCSHKLHVFGWWEFEEHESSDCLRITRDTCGSVCIFEQISQHENIVTPNLNTCSADYSYPPYGWNSYGGLAIKRFIPAIRAESDSIFHFSPEIYLDTSEQAIRSQLDVQIIVTTKFRFSLYLEFFFGHVTIQRNSSISNYWNHALEDPWKELIYCPKWFELNRIKSCFFIVTGCRKFHLLLQFWMLL